MDRAERLIACPHQQWEVKGKPDEKPILMPMERCFERLRFASNTHNVFENGCHLCPTGMSWFREEMMCSDRD